MKKILIALLIVVTAIVIVLGAQKKEINTSGKPVIKIGITLPLTGNVAHLGQRIKRSIEIALKNAQTERNLKYDYELIFEDDQQDPKQILLNYQRFKSINKVNAVMAIWSRSMVISQLTDQDKIIHMTCGWGNDLSKGLYNFNHSTFPQEHAEVLVGELKKRNIKKIGMLQNNYQGEVENKAAIIVELKKAGIELVYDYLFLDDQRDFRMEIAKIKNMPVDALFTGMFAATVQTFIKQANELGFHPQYVGLDTVGYEPQLFEGAWYIADAIGDDAFVDMMKKEIGVVPTSCVANLYDGLNLLIEGYEHARIADGKHVPKNEDVAQTILALDDFKSVMGWVHIDEEGNIHTKPKLAIIKNGETVLIQQ